MDTREVDEQEIRGAKVDLEEAPQKKKKKKKKESSITYIRFSVVLSGTVCTVLL